MSSSAEGGDGPAVLKLAKWDHFPSHYKPSELYEVSLSPARKLLLLLSYGSEAVLLPVIFGKESFCYLKDEIGIYHPDKCTLPVCFQTKSSADILQPPAETIESPHGVRSSSFDSCAVISNVQSFAWGHCGDTYSHYGQSDFQELLLVCTDNHIVIHAFCCSNEDYQVTELVHENEPFHGNWVEWGPLHNLQSEDTISQVHGCENDFGDDLCSNSGLESKQWLRTFLTEMDVFLSGDRFLARFPAKSFYPHSASVVSFDISSISLRFLESCHNFYPDDEEANQDTKVPVNVVGNALLSDSLRDNLANRIFGACIKGRPVKCSRVFSGYSYHMFGLVFTSEENASLESSENEKKNREKKFVVIIRICLWGMEWLCSIDLQKPYNCQVSSSKWADFQFLEKFLVCLTTSGLVCIWCAKTGEPITYFDVLESCGVNAKIHSQPRPRKFSEVDGLLREKMRTFKKLIVTTFSLLLAISDEHGIIYLIDVNDFIPAYGHAPVPAPPKETSQFRNSDLGMLANWKVAGCGICCQKFSSDAFSTYLNALEISGGDFIRTKNIDSLRPGQRKLFHTKENDLDIHKSGFYICSQKNATEISQSYDESSSTSMRRLFFPLHHHSKNASICLSPFGITRLVSFCDKLGEKVYKIVHSDLHVASTFLDDRNLDDCWLSIISSEKDVIVEESIGFSFEGFLYIMTQKGLFVILPSISIMHSMFSVHSTRHWQPSPAACSKYEIKGLLVIDEHQELWRPWQMEVFDRTLLYEGAEEAETICLENGWDIKVARLRRMQLGLQFLKYDEIERSLDMLADVNLAEEGILRLLFTSVYLLVCDIGNTMLVSRLLALASCFATKMVRKYGLAELKKDEFLFVGKDFKGSYNLQLPSLCKLDKTSTSQRLCEMSHFLEVIRDLQSRLRSKNRRPPLGADGGDTRNMVDREIVQDDSLLPIVATESILSDSSSLVNLHEIYVPETGLIESRKLLQNPKNMIERWKSDDIDLKTVVKDAIHSGRLPLAVLQLHLQCRGDNMDEREHYDVFTKVSEIGRAIAYDLFLKGESALAVETLLRLGEDLEYVLRQLLFGTVRRSLRAQIAEEMKSYGYLRTHEWKILESFSLIERLYSSSNFWSTYHGKQNATTSSSITFKDSNIELKFHVDENLVIECGDIDGVIIGSWTNTDDDSAFLTADEENTLGGYWACAAAWADAWDQGTIDRVILDQPINMVPVISWESQMEYHLSHNNLEDVLKLLDVIPPSVLSEESLQINLDHSSCNTGIDAKFPYSSMHICAAEELKPVCLIIPNIKVFRFSAIHLCTSWLKMLVEQRLAKRLIFLKDYWESVDDIVSLLACAGLVINKSKLFVKTKLSDCYFDLDDMKFCEPQKDTTEAFHMLIVHYCSQHNLPYFLDLYLDHHNLFLDDATLCSLREAAGDCQWAKWLLFSRIKGYEYEASFYNTRSNLSRKMVLGSKVNVQGVDEIICTVEDMAEGGGEMAALATLMYESAPMQKCLRTGSVNRHQNTSSQCTLENLRPGLEKFPTLWRALVSSCLGTDSSSSSMSSSSIPGKSTFSDYLRWRDSIFCSSGGDTSLVQMLPFWFSKSIRRLVRLFAQVPFHGHSLLGAISSGDSILYRDHNYVLTSKVDGINPLSWEAAIQKSIEELYTSRKETGSGLQKHLHRGRAMAAFSHLISQRALKLKAATEHPEPLRQTSIQVDVQAILSPLTQNEGSLLQSVIKLAIMHFDDSAMVASCLFLLELCGLSACGLRIDVAVLRRISDYYNLMRENASYDASSKGSALLVSHEGDVTFSLARALADAENAFALNQNDIPLKASKGKRTLQPLIIVLQHLEKASLPSLEEGKTCGFWLSTGGGDGFEFRSQQKDASDHWKLVTEFCQVHHLPLSTKYLSLLANDNDWVGFLMEAQIGGFPTDIVVEVAAKEFSNPRLRTHVLTVLKSMQLQRKKQNSSVITLTPGSNEIDLAVDSDDMVPVELFGLIALCERQKNPGEALLVRAKDLRWSLLAMIASCFPDVSPLSCLTVWLEITAVRETSSIKVNDISSKIAQNVTAAVQAINALPTGCRTLSFRYNRRNPKRRRLQENSLDSSPESLSPIISDSVQSVTNSVSGETVPSEVETNSFLEQSKVSTDPDEALASVSNMVSTLSEQRLFLPLLRAFEMFLPSCSLLPFIRSLQAFSQMRLSEASVHLMSFSSRIKDESFSMQINIPRDGALKPSWTCSTAVKAAEAMLSVCPSAYERRCLLELLAATDFGDGGSTSTYFQRLYWKINVAEPSLRKDEELYLGNETLDDASLLAALENNRCWDQARNWARQLESSGASWRFAFHHVTETQAEAMVTEWKEFLWDVPEERVALWSHCHTLFVRYSFPALQAGSFFLRHADAIEKEIPAKELHEMLLLSLQWLSGSIAHSPSVYPLHLLREIETRVWLLAVESEAQEKTELDYNIPFYQNLVSGNSSSIIDQTATVIEKMDGHLNAMRLKTSERHGGRENSMQVQRPSHASDSISGTVTSSSRTKRRTKAYPALRRHQDNLDISNDSDDTPHSPHNLRGSGELSKSSLPEENVKIESAVSGWEEKVKPADMERAVLSLLEFGQVTAAKKLQQKLSPAHVPSELAIVDTALKVAAISSSSSNGEIRESMMDAEVLSFIQSLNIQFRNHVIDTLQVLGHLSTKCGEGCGRGLCWRIIAVVKAAKILGLTFTEAFEKRPLELLQLLSLKAQDSLEEAKLLVKTHFMPPASIARILAESFLKGLLAAHRGGYIESQKEEGPAPLLWRFSDFLKWAELCPSEPEIGHALMRLVMTGQEIPHDCEVELLILSHHFYKSSACLDGVDVLVTLAANRVESYVSEGDFSCLARLVTGVSNFHALNFILNILIDNGQLVLLLHKYSTADSAAGSTESVRGFRMAVLTSLRLFSPHDLDAFAIVYNHFDMKHETAALLESRSSHYVHWWLSHHDRDRQAEDLLESMRHLIEAAEVYSTIDAGFKTHYACAQAALLSLQIRIPDLTYIELSETNARRVLVEQSRFQEALIVAEAYGLNQPSEWAPVLWNQMLKPDIIEQFVSEFVAVLPLQPPMLLELARFFRAEVAARGDQSHFSVWLSPGGLPAEWARHLGKSFRSLLRRTRDLRLRLQLASIATGFTDIVNSCNKFLDKVPDNAGPLILKRGHGGTYLPLM